ncbi:unnamed protein product [Closterium sp. Yama58-4]|nr:unnamed protein product [Closterium sp. Yama58-4]
MVASATMATTATATATTTTTVMTTVRRKRTTGPVILHAADVQRDGSVILRFAPLPDPLAPTARALGPAAAIAHANGNSSVAVREGGAAQPGRGAAEVRADAGVVAFVTACTSEFSREVPDALIEEIVGLPLRLTPCTSVCSNSPVSPPCSPLAILPCTSLLSCLYCRHRHHWCRAGRPGSVPSLSRRSGGTRAGRQQWGGPEQAAVESSSSYSAAAGGGSEGVGGMVAAAPQAACGCNCLGDARGSQIGLCALWEKKALIKRLRNCADPRWVGEALGAALVEADRLGKHEGSYSNPHPFGGNPTNLCASTEVDSF